MKPARPGLTAPLRHRDFRLLWLGLSVSLAGDGIFLVAVAWQAYTLVNRPEALAAVGVATSLPQLVLLLFAGAVSDRLDRRRILIYCDVARAAAVAALGALTVAGAVHLWQLYLAAGVIGVATAFASPAMDALVPELVPVGELTQANAVDQFVRPMALQLAGPALGGVAVATLHPAGAFWLDALTFLFSAACVARMARGSPVAVEERAGMWSEIGAGLGYVRRRVWLWGTFAAATLAYLLFFGPTQVLLPYLVRNSLHASAAAYGGILALGGLGALLGAVVMARRREVRRPVTWMYLWWTLATLAVAGYGIARDVWWLAASAVVVNGGEAVGAVLWATLKQRRVPLALLGRVSSIDWFISTALLPLSYALTAPAAALLGARTTLVLAGTVGGAVTLGFLFLPGMRDESPRSADAHRAAPATPGAGAASRPTTSSAT